MILNFKYSFFTYFLFFFIVRSILIQAIVEFNNLFFKCLLEGLNQFYLIIFERSRESSPSGHIVENVGQIAW